MKAIKSDRWRKTNRRPGESGQAILLLLLALGIFLMGAVALSVDVSNMWFHRQAGQNAADAACMAGAMDMLVDAQGGATGHQGFTVGTNFNCAKGSAATPCKYAAFNGYDSSGTATSGNLVNVLFPNSSVVPGLPTGAVPPTALAPNAFIQVNVTDNVPTYFSGLLSGRKAQAVRASAVCGIVLASAPIPILVLDPKNPGGNSAFRVQGTPNVAIFGGPARSIQVNSRDPLAVSIGGTATVDLSKGGPSNTGSDLGVWGGPVTAPTGFIPGTTGHWVEPAATIDDPFKLLPAPTKPAAGSVTLVPFGTDGCIDTNCYEYTPGDYSTSWTCLGSTCSGICVGQSCPIKATTTAIFQTGIYYIEGNFSADSKSCLRPSTKVLGSPNNIGGTMFYFHGNVSVDANSGSKCSAANPFNTTTGTGPYLNGIKCTATSSKPGNIPATLTGNVLLAPCTGPYGDVVVAATGSPDPTLGVQRGMLLFQDRSSIAANPSWGGGGTFLLAGTMYFHSCNSTGTGIGCGSPPTYFSDVFTLQGGSGASTYLLGDIIVDNLSLGGNSGITMDLNPSVSYSILKATLLR